MALTDIDILPFISTSDGSPSLTLNMAILLLSTSIVFHLIYTTSVALFSDKKKAARIAPFVHAIFATTSSIYVIYNDLHHSVFETPSSICIPIGPTQYIFCISLGYFCWDLYICFKEKWSIDWKIHAAFCVLMYGTGLLKHTLHRWG
eukprot:324059_1